MWANIVTLDGSTTSELLLFSADILNEQVDGLVLLTPLNKWFHCNLPSHWVSGSAIISLFETLRWISMKCISFSIV